MADDTSNDAVYQRFIDEICIQDGLFESTAEALFEGFGMWVNLALPERVSSQPSFVEFNKWMSTKFKRITFEYDIVFCGICLDREALTDAITKRALTDE